MAGLPYREHYVGDWLRETRHLSLVAKAVLHELRDLMWDRPRRGVLDNDDGSAWSDDKVIPLIAASEQTTARQGLNELLADSGNMVVRNENGALCCPSMIEGERIRRLRSDAGRRGFQAKNEDRNGLLNQTLKQTLKQKRKQNVKMRMKDEDDVEIEPEGGAGGVRPKGGRKPDPIWDTVAELWYPSGVPKSQTNAVGRIVSDLKSLGATRQTLLERRSRMIAAWTPKGVECTARALVNHWDRFSKDTPTEPECPEWIMEGARAGRPKT